MNSETNTAYDTVPPGTGPLDTVSLNEIVTDADAQALEGRARVVLPPRSLDPEEALAENQAAQAEAAPAPPPSYADLAHLLPR